MNEKVGFRELMKDHNFMKLYLSGIVSRFGDAVDAIAYGYMVYELTGSAALMAVLFAINGIPALILGMISGVLVTYLPKKAVVYTCDLMRGIVVICTGVLYFMGTLEVWHLYVFTVLNSTFEVFREPAASVLFLDIVDQDRMEHAQSMNMSGRTFAELIGYSIAAILIGVIGVGGAIVLDGLTFIVSFGIIKMIANGKEIFKKEKLTVAGYFVDLKEGFDYSFKLPLVRFLVVFVGVIVVLFIPFNTMQIPYIIENLQLEAFGLSVLNVSFLGAMIVGSLLVPILSSKIGRRKVFIIGGAVIGVGYLLLGCIEVFSGTFIGYITLAVVSMIMGSTIGFVNIPLAATLMTKVDRDMMSRVTAFMNMLALAAVPISAGLVGLLVKVIKIPTMFVFMGGATVLLFVGLSLNKTVYELNDEVEADAQLVE